MLTNPKNLISYVLQNLPEGNLKHFIRTQIINVRTGLPKELMINQGDTVVQIGIWRTSTALRIAKSVGSQGKILIVEISGNAIADVQSALEKAGYSNFQIINKGAWEHPGNIELIEEVQPSATRIDTGRLHPEAGENSTSTLVEVDTIENMCSTAGINAIDYIEITINGAELHALKGMGALLQSTKRLWVAGLTRDAKTGLPLNHEIASYLKSHGFNTKISQPGKKVDNQWGKNDGHVYAWK